MKVLAYVMLTIVVIALATGVSGCTQFLADIQKTGMGQAPDKVDYNLGGSK